MAEWVVEPLDRTHERSSFSCGNSALDDFLRHLVSQYEKRRLGRTYVALRPAERRVLGYYTLASGAVSFASLPPAHGKKLPRHPVPVVLLARLAVALEAQGRGLGRFLLVDALRRCHELSERLGVHAVEVDAKRFYEKYGFVALADDGNHLYLTIETIRKGLRGR